MLRENLPESLLLMLAPLFFVLLVDRSLLELKPHIESDHSQRAGEQERDTPAPTDELLWREHGRQQRVHRGPEHKPAQGAELQPRAHESASAIRGVLGNERGRPAVLTAGGKPLEQPTNQQQDWCEDANGGV